MERNTLPIASTSALEYVPKLLIVNKLSSSCCCSASCAPFTRRNRTDRCAGLARVRACTVDFICGIERDAILCSVPQVIVMREFWLRVGVRAGLNIARVQGSGRAFHHTYLLFREGDQAGYDRKQELG